MVPHLPFQNLYLRYLKHVRATASHPHALFPVGMQPGVCFGKETELLTGERVIFLVETDVYRRQKGLFYKPKTTFFSLPKLWPERSGKETKVFLPKPTFPMRKSKFRGSKQTFFGKVRLKLESQDKFRWS